MSGVIFYLTILAASISICWTKPAELFIQVPTEYPQGIKWVSHRDARATDLAFQVPQVLYSAEVPNSRSQKQLNLIHVNAEESGDVPVYIDPVIKSADTVESFQNRAIGVEYISRKIDPTIRFDVPIESNLVNSEEYVNKQENSPVSNPSKVLVPPVQISPDNQSEVIQDDPRVLHVQPVISETKSSVSVEASPASNAYLPPYAHSVGKIPDYDRIHTSDQDTEVIEGFPPVYRDNETEIVDTYPQAEEHPQFDDYYPPQQPQYDYNVTQTEVQQPEYDYNLQPHPEEPVQYDYYVHPEPEEQQQPQYDYDQHQQSQYDYNLHPQPEEPQQPQYDYNVQPQQKEQQPQYNYDLQSPSGESQQPQYDVQSQQEPQQPQLDYGMQPQQEGQWQPQYDYNTHNQPLQVSYDNDKQIQPEELQQRQYNNYVQSEKEQFNHQPPDRSYLPSFLPAYNF